MIRDGGVVVIEERVKICILNTSKICDEKWNEKKVEGRMKNKMVEME